MLRTAFMFSALATTVLASSILSVTVIPAPSGSTTEGMLGINSSGEVAGWASNFQAFIGTTLGSTVIPLPGGGVSIAQGYALNDSGQVTGFSFDPGRAFIGTPSGSTLIPLPAGATVGSYSQAVNDSGQVAGAAFATETEQAFIGTAAESALIPLPSGFLSSGANGINSSGQVTGWVSQSAGFSPDFDEGPGLNQAVVGTILGLTAIPLAPACTYSLGMAINDSGEVAGTCEGSISQAFIGTAGGSTLIPLPIGATYADVNLASINDQGMVVGGSDAGGWIWDASDGTVLLNGLVPPGWNVEDAVSINNNGLILAQASYQGGPEQYVELGPGSAQAPEPGTCYLAGAGLILAAFLASRSGRQYHENSERKS